MVELARELGRSLPDTKPLTDAEFADLLEGCGRFSDPFSVFDTLIGDKPPFVSVGAEDDPEAMVCTFGDEAPTSMEIVDIVKEPASTFEPLIEIVSLEGNRSPLANIVGCRMVSVIVIETDIKTSMVVAICPTGTVSGVEPL